MISSKYTWLKKFANDALFKSVVGDYNKMYGVDLSDMKFTESNQPYFNNGKKADIPLEQWGGNWTKKKEIYINKDLDAVMKYYGIKSKLEDFKKLIIAHELAHEIYNRKNVSSKFKGATINEAKNKKFTTPYLDHVSKEKLNEEMFCEYLADKLVNM